MGGIMAMGNPPASSRFDPLRNLPLLVTIGAAVVIVLAYFVYAPFRGFLHNAWSVLTSEDRQRIREWTMGFGLWGPLVLMGFFIVQMFAFFLPSWLLIVVSVLAYGPLLGGVLALAGIALAASIAYLIGKSLSVLTVRRLIGEKSEHRMRVYLNRYGFWLVTIFRLAPFLSNDIISYVAGLTAMSYGRFIAATVLGISPLITLIAYLGETNERLRNGFVVVSVVSLIGFAIYVWWDRRQMAGR
jgi:uncharacterized membrane protein YdjX (TVP38/TMEM64 family)